MNYATAEQTADLVPQATPDEKWLSEQLDRIAPERLEMGAAGDLPALTQLVIELRNKGSVVPRIGQPWPEQGGIYAGIMAGRDGQPDYHLILAPAEQGSFEDVEWGPYGKSIEGASSYFDGRANTAAMAAADIELGARVLALQIDGHADYHLPSQAEMHLLAANLKDQFEQDDWYWTSTQYSSITAWLQDFSYGTQSSSLKDVEARARAVRRFNV